MISCKSFENRLDDYIHGELADGFMAAMEIHMEECPSCKKLYEEEVKIYNGFKSYFNEEGLEFKSLRSEILKKIDKNRYNGGLVAKVQFWVRKNAVKYFMSAAILMLAVIGAINLFSLHKATENGNYQIKGSLRNYSMADKMEQGVKADMPWSPEEKQKNAVSRFGGKPIEKIEKVDVKSMVDSATMKKSALKKNEYFDGEFYYEVDYEGNIFSVSRKDVSIKESKSVISDKEAVKRAENMILKLTSQEVIDKLSKEIKSYSTEVKKLDGQNDPYKGYSISFKGKNLNGEYIDGHIYVEISADGQLIKAIVYIEDEQKYMEKLFNK